MRLLFSLLFVALAAFVNAQQRPLPDGLFAGFRWFRETDGALDYQRSNDPVDYQLSKGWGFLVIYSEQVTERFGAKVESGYWWFKNDASGATSQGIGFHQSAITLPLMIGASATVLKSGPIVLYVDLNGGVAYTQYIKHLDGGGIRVEHRTELVYGPTIVVSVNLFRVPGGYKTGPRIGNSYFNLGGQTIHSLYGTIW